jgi:hypothetical protein
MVMIVNLVLLAMAGYLLIGSLFGAWFIVSGVRRVDVVAAHTSLRVRWVWFPGAVLLWPLLIAIIVLRKTQP